MDSVKTPSTPALTTPSPQFQTSTGESGGVFSNLFYIILAIVLILSILTFLGFNLLAIGGELDQKAVTIFGPALNKLLQNLGYSSGELLNDSSEAAAGVLKTGVDIADGTLHSVGNLLKASKGGKAADGDETDSEEKPEKKKKEKPSKLDSSINKGKASSQKEPKPDSGASSIQKSPSSKKSNWCLVGEYEGKRGCIEVGDQDKCMSGQVFPSQKMCLNPNFTKNPKP